MPPILIIAMSLYLLNLGVGLAAWAFGVGFGWLHHALYAVVFAAAIGATVFAFHPALLLTLAALAALPKTKPKGRAHPLLALLGFVGYVVAALAWI